MSFNWNVAGCGIDHLIRHPLQRGELFPLQADTLHERSARGEWVRPPRFTEPVKNCLVGGIEKEDLDPVPLFLQPREDPCILLGESALPEVHDHRYLRNLLGRIGLDLQKLRQQNHRQIVDAEKTDVFESSKGGTFPGTRKPRNDNNAQLFHHPSGFVILFGYDSDEIIMRLCLY
jgi:hypothetical protein